ncbi:MAG TPA: family 43 glycosylhydrolase [Rubrobacteraceae bacterium]|nr:family 43 glycosylhydrolase [Rubrobacteraceae bacterium]
MARATTPLRILGLVVLALVLLSSSAGHAQETAGTYTNPVSKTFADTFADPAVIKGKDGYWYAYGTTDPLREGERTYHTIPISRSKDLVDWTYVGDAFNAFNRPSWAAPDGNLWAPDIRYIDGRYYMYYVVTQTTVTDEPNDNAIGVATASTPAGPWTDSGDPVVEPRRGSGNPGDFKWTFDPSQFTDSDGKRYLYYGSYYGGIFVTELSEDGTETVGEPTMVALDNRYEGAYVVKHDGYYYLFASSANCCAGPTTGYSVYVGRSESPRGPFVDREGVSMTESRVGGTIVVTPNGNKWVGTGHNAIVTDLSGEDYFVYHAIDRADPYLDEPYGINERPMLLDRLDWIDGWPTVRGGEWASESPQPAPVTTPLAGDSFNSGTTLGSRWKQNGGRWTLSRGGDAGGYARQASPDRGKRFLLHRTQPPADARVEGDLRLSGGQAAGVVVRYKNPDNHAVAWLDRAANALVTEAVVDGRAARRSAPLPVGFAFDEWHNVAVEVRGSRMTAEVTDARLHDPYAVSELTLPARLSSGAAGFASRDGSAEADNFSATALYVPSTRTAPAPRVGAPVYSDEFDHPGLDSGWSWVREDPDTREEGGVLSWPTQAADLVGTGNNAGVLLRDAPQSDYVVETKLTIDLGTDTVRNFQQGGLVAYVNDDHFLRLSHVAIWNTRQTEFGKEMPFAGRLSFGGMLVGPPDETTWLRLAHRVDPQNGEHEFRAATRREGEPWIWGGVWTLPANTDPRIGLISHGGDQPPATSEFDYFRVYGQ